MFYETKGFCFNFIPRKVCKLLQEMFSDNNKRVMIRARSCDFCVKRTLYPVHATEIMIQLYCAILNATISDF